MPKQPSTITIAKIGDGFSVDAKGAFGGGWTKHCSLNELQGTIIRAWQMYGSNPMGCSIIGAPEELRGLVDQLTGGGDEKDTSIMVRLSSVEKNLIQQAAESAGQSVNQWCREKLLTYKKNLSGL